MIGNPSFFGYRCVIKNLVVRTITCLISTFVPKNNQMLLPISFDQFLIRSGLSKSSFHLRKIDLFVFCSSRALSSKQSSLEELHLYLDSCWCLSVNQDNLISRFLGQGRATRSISAFAQRSREGLFSLLFIKTEL